MDIRRLLPRARMWRVVGAAIILPVFSCLLFYLALLSAEYVSVHQASRILNRLEAIRPGDPAARFEEAVKGCAVHGDSSGYDCQLIAGGFRFQPLLTLMSKLPLEQNFKLSRLLDRAGLRAWVLFVSSSVQDGRIKGVSVRVFVVGQGETLGAKWGMSQQVPTMYLRDDSGPDQRRTLIHWFHITSLPGGQGLSIDATPMSTEKEVRARRINRSCLFSFRGCASLCELLPDVVPVLQERKEKRGQALEMGCPWK